MHQMEGNTAQIQLPPKLVPVFAGKARYRYAWGGRGGAKTRAFALMTAIYGYKFGNSGREGQLLCAREFMNSLSESSFEEIKMAIRSVDWLDDYYEIGDRYIRSKDRRISYTFSGLRHNLDSIKSKARILLCWVDEAESVSEAAWRKLIPTVREEDSELFVTWNPESKESATHKRFRENPPANGKGVEINWNDNPWFPDVLNQERLDDLKNRPDTYQHIWEGDFLIHVEGAYYAKEMLKAANDERITRVPHNPATAVITAWDLGLSDTTAITFMQKVGQEIRIIDSYENSGYGLDHYVGVLQQRGYNYSQHILPHDVRVRELGTGKSRLEVLRNLGLNNITVAPMLSVDDGIQAVRSMIPMCWFDETKCERLIDALRQYSRGWDDNGKTWKSKPLHDWSSHFADSFRYLAVGMRREVSGGPLKRNIKGIA